MKAVVVTLAALLPLVLCATLEEDDLTFDDAGEETTQAPVIQFNEPQRVWDVPNDTAIIGHVFELKIPKLVSNDPVDYYEVRSNDNKPLPSWWYFEKKSLTLRGVPSKRDRGQYRINRKAVLASGDVVAGVFTIDVVPDKLDIVKQKHKTHAGVGRGRSVVISIYLDGKFDDLHPSKRVSAISNLARYLGINMKSITMHPYDKKDDEGYRVSMRIKGNVGPRKNNNNSLTVIEWEASCLHDSCNEDLVKQLKTEAPDGTLAEVLQRGVLYLHVKSPDTTDFLRNRRDIGSGDGANDDDYEYEAYDDDDESTTDLPPSGPGQLEPEHPHRHHHGEESDSRKIEEAIDEHNIIPVVSNKLEGLYNTTGASTTTTMPTLTTTQQPTTTAMTTSTPSTTTTTIITSTSPSTTTTTSTTMPPTLSTTEQDTVMTVSSTTISPISTITASGPGPTDPIEGTKSEILQEVTEDNAKIEAIETVTSTQPITSVDIDLLETTTAFSILTTGSSPLITTVATVTENQEVNRIISGAANDTIDEHVESTENSTVPATTVTLSSTTQSVLTTSSQIPIVETSTPLIMTTTPLPTEPPTTPMPTTSPTPSTTTTQLSTSKKVEYGVRNYPPRQDRKLQKVPITAGKALSYIIPANTFSDIEDGDTRSLRLSLKLKGSPLKSTHWLQFNSETQEVYGLPLEEHVSTWEYDLVATDREGLEVSDKLYIYVRQHPASRSVNYEFTIYLKIDKRAEFLTDLDWEIKVLRGLAELYNDPDLMNITVRGIDIEDDKARFTWTIDSIPQSASCPVKAIFDLRQVLISDKNYTPSARLQQAVGPEMHVSRVELQGIGQCEKLTQLEQTTVTQINNPIPRNQVDHINATVGQLLIFRVPEDSFWDPEDGSARNMRMSLLTANRTEIPADHWLQFDVKNQEFYGVPMQKDVGRREYQLVVTDKDGASATDGLIVVVHPAPEIKPSVEFTTKLGVDYNTFVRSAMLKRNFIEKLQILFNDRDVSTVSLTSIIPVDKNPLITWINTTLSTSKCMDKEIARLSEVLFIKNDNMGMKNQIQEIMGKEFPVDQLSLTPMGVCQGNSTRVHSHDSNIPPLDDSTSVGASSDDYIITFVLPAIIIATMLLLTAIVACVLYKRRRSGKMSVSEHDDERQSFRSKGIPVIFQDELEEKPDPGNKSPVILKEEKPPLPPPEYQKSDDGADQPMLPKENSEEPYQPPPPFARNSDNNRQNRPKPTPTYRKPPPYVPP